jgi:murein DD-endopeptidase MepM/ murein hydrolase activator NlpD
MNNFPRLPRSAWLLFTFLLVCAACQVSGEFPTEVPTETAVRSTTTPSTVTSTPFVSKPISAPKVQESIRILESVQEVAVKSEIPTPEPTLEPLQIDLSAPNQDKVSNWRPALYPVPLALTPFDHFYFTRPYAVNETGWPVEDYRYGGSFYEDVVHSGMDIKIPVGTPIIAAGPGKVTWAGYGLFAGRYDPDDPYGMAVMIRHSFGHQGALLYTVYAHLDQVFVEKDQQVEAGDLIGMSGETGATSGPHLHFEVRLDDSGQGFFSTRNPELWLVPPQGWGVLAGVVMNTGGRKVKGQLVIVHPPDSEQFWRANSYHGGTTNPDPYYQENLVISDLPAGRYEIQINYLSKIYTREIDIYPGLVTYFTFRGRSGFTSETPPLPGADFDPPQSP